MNGKDEKRQNGEARGAETRTMQICSVIVEMIRERPGGRWVVREAG
jgi:hypothetical protein